MSVEKNRALRQFRRNVLRSHLIKETCYADLSLIDISFQSVLYPQRMVWIGMYSSRKNRFLIDLEQDGDSEASFDVICSIAVHKLPQAIQVVQWWLYGKDWREMIQYSWCHVEFLAHPEDLKEIRFRWNSRKLKRKYHVCSQCVKRRRRISRIRTVSPPIILK